MISLFIRQNADTIALTFLRDSRCSSLLFLLSYTFPFASIHSCICGYSLGLKQTKIPAVSQLLEQAFRILSVIVICMYCSGQGQNISIAFAVAGLTFGEIAASFYSLHSIRQSWKQISEKSRSVFLPPAAFRRHLQRLLEHALPLTASRVFLNILQSVEAVSIPVCLQYYGMPAAQSLQTYGVLTGMALPCILFPSAVTNAVSSMLLPTVAGLQEMKDRQQLRSLILKITCSCILLGCFCCGVLLILGKWIGIFLFKSPLAGNFILTLAWICPFLYTNTVLLSMRGSCKQRYSGRLLKARRASDLFRREKQIALSRQAHYTYVNITKQVCCVASGSAPNAKPMEANCRHEACAAPARKPARF